MLERLVHFVTKLPPEELSTTTIQDVGICSAWFNSYRGLPAEQKPYAAVPKVLANWTASVRPHDKVTEGRRHQWVLRELIDELAGGWAGGLGWDELEFLCCVHALAGKVKDPGLFARVASLLEPHRQALTRLRDALEATPALPGLSKRLYVVTADDIEAAPRREIKTLAGIGIPGLGPVLAQAIGHVRVLDNVPENCTLVVEKGSCSVEGFVMGRLAATFDCEVRENISGVVVVRRGDIRTRNIIDKAYVISKQGTVHCRHSQAPDLVFAGREIRIEDAAIMGCYVSPRIQVGGEAYGGEFHASESVAAEQFRRSDTRELALVLRRDISCRDYGETPDENASNLMATAAQLRRRIRDLATQARFADRESEQCAATAVVHLVGGKAKEAAVERLQAAEKRLGMLDQIITSFAAMGERAEDQLSAMSTTRSPGDEGRPASLEPIAVQEVRGAELTALEADRAEGNVDRDIEQEISDLSTIAQKLLSSSADKRRMLILVMRIRERLAHWTAEQRELVEAVERTQGEQASGASPQQRPGLRALQELLAVARERGPNDPLVLGLQSGYVRVALRTLRTLRERAQQFQEQISRLREEFDGVKDKLRRDYNIVVWADRSDSPEPPVAVGRFDEGVGIYGDPFLVGEDSLAADAMLRTPRPNSARQKYVRREDGTIAPVAVDD